mgnify:CR=1 FL=1
MDEDMRIRKVSASEQVCEAIQAQISSGTWKVGEKLPSESELASKFGVNRLTVRMALQKLNALGIVETRTGSGTFVIEFDFESYLKTASKFYERSGMMQNVTEFRNHIEIECARLAIERATEEDLCELERLALKHREAWADTEGLTHEEWCKRVAAADLAFHEHVCRISHNPLYAYAFAVAREPIHSTCSSACPNGCPSSCAASGWTSTATYTTASMRPYAPRTSPPVRAITPP